MKIVKAVVLIYCSLLLCDNFSYAQVTSVVIPTSKCDYIQSNLTTNPSGTWNHNFGVGTYSSRRGSLYRRGFVEFDLSSIPQNAIIYEATLKITHNGSQYVLNPWVTKLVTSSWSEGLITSSNQPTISGSSSDWSTISANAGDTINLDVKEMVQRMVYGQVDNYGWSIQVSNEAAPYTSGTFFRSDEYPIVAYRPRLLVRYYLPMTLSNVSVQHESETGANDGEITLTHTPIDPSGHSYTWVNAFGGTVGNNLSLTGVSYGWYGLEITGNSNGEKEYYGFLVGTECEEVTISYTTQPNFTGNAYVFDWVNSSGIDYKDVNNGNSPYFRTDNRFSGSWYDVKSYLDFNTWMDDAFTINQADLLLEGYYHSNVGTTNTADFHEVTSYWNEDAITWNTTPTNEVSAALTVPNTTSPTQDATVDMISLWDEWKMDNNSNYGILFRLQAFDDDYQTNQIYYSPNGTMAYRPQWTFKLALTHANNPIFCEGAEGMPYNELKKELDGGYGESYDDKLNFVFDEAYNVDAGLYLVTAIYNDDHQIEARCNASGTTFGGIPALTYAFDDNRYVMDLSGITTLVDQKFYVLEVQNTKGDRFFLKFKHNE